MAVTEFGVNHPLAVKLYSKKLLREALKSTWFNKFLGKGSDSLLQKLDETKKGPGDQITYGLRVLLAGAGVQGDGTLKGSEESMTFYSDSLLINQLRHAVKSAGKMSEQRVPYSVREEARMGLSDWLAAKIDASFMNQLAGNTYITDTKVTGNNTVTAPDSNHRIYSTGNGEATLSASSIFSLTLLDKAVAKAKTLSPMIRPLRIGGEDKYVCFIHPYQHLQLRTNTDTAQFMDINKAALQGGQYKNNPIYTGALFEYNNVIIHESFRVPWGVSGASGANADTLLGVTSVARAVFCGAQSGILALGQDSSTELSANWFEELDDYGNQLGVAAGLIFGIKKSIFNSADFGTITISSFSPAPT